MPASHAELQDQATQELMMLREIAFLAMFLPAAAFAQSASDGSSMMSPGMMDHSRMHAQMMGGAPTEPGQSAFAAIQEIVELLESDPKTDWSKVDIDALRAHLVDMDAVTLHATVDAQPVNGGMAFRVTGEGPVADSIRRMVMAHAAIMNGQNGWQYRAEPIAEGAILTVTPADPAQLVKLRGLGFIGIMAEGMHHQMHHMMLARGFNPH